MYSMHHGEIYRLRRGYPPLRLTSELVDLRLGYAKWSQQSFVSNSSDSKCKRPRHSATCESSCFLRFPRKCFIFLEFWMTAFHPRPCKSRAKFKHNQICTVCIKERYLVYSEDSLTLRLVSKLPDLRVANAKWFQ